MSMMTKTLSIAVVLGALAACTGGNTGPKKSEEPAVVKPAAPSADRVGTKLATVGGLPVGTAGFEMLSARKTPANGVSFSMEEKKEILDEVITDEVLFQAAFEEALYQDPKVRKILVNLLLRAEVYGNVGNEDFTEEEQRTYYAEHKEEFVVPEKRQVKRIFVAVSDSMGPAAAEKKAAEARTKVLADPETFREVAEEFSDGPFKRRGGDLGYISLDGKPGIPPEVTRNAFDLAVGEASEPFLAGGGYNIVYVVNQRERLERTFEQMRGSVLRRLKNDKFERMADEFVTKLKAKRPVQIDEAALESYDAKKEARPGLPLPGAAANLTPPPKPVVPASKDDDDLDANDEARLQMEEDERDEGEGE